MVVALLDSFISLGEKDMNSAKIRNTGCRIKDDITYKGMQALFLENELLRVGILLDKGADVFEFLYKPRDLDFIWLSPFGISRPDKYSLTKNQAQGRFMDLYEGGWQEILPNGGSPCNYKGIEFGQHEEVALLPWSCRILSDEQEEIEVELSTETRLMPLRLVRRMKLASGVPTLFMDENLVNKSTVDLEVIWGHHLTYGDPFLEGGCLVNIPACKGLTYDKPGVIDENIPLSTSFDWPLLPIRDEIIDLSSIPSRDTKTSKFLYLSQFEKAEYEIFNPGLGIKILAKWNLDIMPYLWFWQEFNKTEGYPWYGMSRVFGLEPFSTDVMGLDNTVARGRGITVKPHTTIYNFLNVTVSHVKPGGQNEVGS